MATPVKMAAASAAALSRHLHMAGDLLIRTFHERWYVRRFKRELRRRIYTELDKMRQQKIPLTAAGAEIIVQAVQSEVNRDAFARVCFDVVVSL